MADWQPKEECNPEHWVTTAPTEPEEAQQDTTSTYDVKYNSEGIACCAGVGD